MHLKCALNLGLVETICGLLTKLDLLVMNAKRKQNKTNKREKKKKKKHDIKG